MRYLPARFLFAVVAAGMYNASCSTEPGATANMRDDASKPGERTDASAADSSVTPDGTSSPDAGRDGGKMDGSTPVPPDAGKQDAGGNDAGMWGPIAARGDDSTLDIGCWNIEWFGSTGNGPSNEATQLTNAQLVIKGTHLDIWGLAEIVSATSFQGLLSGLPGYAGILANDPKVTDGSSNYDAGEQKVALVYRTDVATLLSAKVILSEETVAFAGRPPLEAQFKIEHDKVAKELTVIVLHAKAINDLASWTKRSNAATALKAYLDSEHATNDVMVLGDFNDLIDGSITGGQASPYAAFVADSTDYTFVTQALDVANIGTTVGRTTAIDHHLITNELHARFIENSVLAYRVDSMLTDYADSTSDHYPVLSRYEF